MLLYVRGGYSEDKRLPLTTQVHTKTPEMNDAFLRRFQELEDKYKFIPFNHSDSGYVYAKSGTWEGWATSAHHLIKAVFGDSSIHNTQFASSFQQCNGERHDIARLFAIFSAAKEDFEGGYLFNVELRISGEVFGDFVTLARTSLGEGHKDVAAVLACAALEDALKRYAAVNQLPVEGKAMADVVNALKGAGLVAGAQKTLLDTMPRIRNMALHGEWAKLSEPDVSSVLGFVEQFLLSKFQGS